MWKASTHEEFRLVDVPSFQAKFDKESDTLYTALPADCTKDITRSQYQQPIRTSLRVGTSRIELPRNAIRVIEADVLGMGLWIFLNPIVADPGRV